MLRRSPRWRARLALYGGLAAGLLALWGAAQRTAADDVEQLVALARASHGAQRRFRSTAGHLALFRGHGYAVTLYVGDQPGFAPARFLTLSRIDGELLGELMFPEGIGLEEQLRTEELRGQPLDAYLQRGGLSPAPLDALYGAYYRTPSAPLVSAPR